MNATDLKIGPSNLLDHKPIIRKPRTHPHPGIFILSHWIDRLDEIKYITHFLGKVILDVNAPFEFHNNVKFYDKVVRMY